MLDILHDRVYIMDMKNNDLTGLINQTIDRILDEWNAEADEQGIDRIDYYETQVEALENEPGRFTAKAISQRHLQRVMGVA